MAVSLDHHAAETLGAGPSKDALGNSLCTPILDSQGTEMEAVTMALSRGKRFLVWVSSPPLPSSQIWGNHDGHHKAPASSHK